jgi:uncharacterized protein YndB with AHSA1/START domain
MWFELRKESVDFADRSPLLWQAEATVAAPRSEVFAVLVDPQSWHLWFPGLENAFYSSPPPHGVGSIREARVRGSRWIEEIIEWRQDTRYAWTVTAASVPLSTAQIESFALADEGTGTRVRFTIALEPRLLGRLGAPFASRTVERLWQRAAANLTDYLRSRLGSGDDNVSAVYRSR